MYICILGIGRKIKEREMKIRRKGIENAMKHGNEIREIGKQSYTGRRLEIQARDRGDTGKRPGRYRQETGEVQARDRGDTGKRPGKIQARGREDASKRPEIQARE